MGMGFAAQMITKIDGPLLAYGIFVAYKPEDHNWNDGQPLTISSRT